MNELPDAERVVETFERGRMILPALDHERHVYLAWCYLTTLPLLDALARLPRAIRRFATEHGNPEKFNATVTVAYLVLIHERIQLHAQADWDTFRGSNPDLFSWPDGPVTERYSPQRLHSREARKNLVPPDRLLGR